MAKGNQMILYCHTVLGSVLDCELCCWQWAVLALVLDSDLLQCRSAVLGSVLDSEKCHWWWAILAVHNRTEAPQGLTSSLALNDAGHLYMPHTSIGKVGCFTDIRWSN